MFNLMNYYDCAENLEKEIEKVMEYLKSDAPIDERWDIYVKIESDMPVMKWAFGFTSFDKEISPYDDFYMKRYQEKSWQDIIEDILDEPEKFNIIDESDTRIVALKDEMLKSGYGGFTNDW